MSTLKPSKNIEGLIDAFKNIKKKYDYQLVIVGKKGWLYESIFEKVKKLDLGEEVVFTDYLNDDERGAILKGSKVFVLPSFWEGFGIDVLNAYSCGVPVVVSDRASLPEVAGKAGIFVDPEKTQSITRGILKVLKMNPKEYNNRVKMGYRQLESFSWSKAAHKVQKILIDKAKQ